MLLASAAVPPFSKNGFLVSCEDTREAVLIDPGDEVDALLRAARTFRVPGKAHLWIEQRGNGRCYVLKGTAYAVPYDAPRLSASGEWVEAEARFSRARQDAHFPDLETAWAAALAEEKKQR